MESIEFGGRRHEVREVGRPEGALCRVLVTDDGSPFLEYVVSVGPYKTDISVLHRLSREDFAAWQAGRVDLGFLARNLAEHDQHAGTYERRD